MDLNTFHKHISTVTLHRGKQYYDQGAVVLLQDQEFGFWYAEVEGSQLYSVQVELSGSYQIEGYSCDCPHDVQVCKHIVAVLYELRDHIRNPFKYLIEEEEIDDSSLQKDQNVDLIDLVNRLDVGDLKGFVISHALKDRHFTSALFRAFQNQNPVTDLQEQYTQQIREAARASNRQGFINRRAASTLAGKLNDYLTKASEDFLKENFKDAYIISKTVMQELVGQIIEQAEDSDGHLQNVLSDALAVIEMLALSSRCDKDIKKDIHRYLANALETNDYFAHGDFGEDCFDIFRHLSAELNESEAFLALCDGNIVEPSSVWIDNYRTAFYTKQKISFFDHIGDADQALKLINENLYIFDIRYNYVLRLIESTDYQQAKKLIYEGLIIAEQSDHAGIIFSWQKQLLRIADLESDTVTTRELSYLLAFEGIFNAEYYLKWKSTFPAHQWQAELVRLVENVVEAVELEAQQESANHWWSKNQTLLSRLAPIYIEEKLWHPLFKLVEAYPSLEALLRYMHFLADDYESEVAEMLCLALILAGDKADSRSAYAQIASQMKDIIHLMPDRKPQILAAAQELRYKYPRRKAMLDEFRGIR